MKIYAYTPANGLHWTPSELYESLGQCGGKHYFAIPADETIPEQPAEIGFAEVTDTEELKRLLDTAPYFFRWRGTTELRPRQPRSASCLNNHHTSCLIHPYRRRLPRPMPRRPPTSSFCTRWKSGIRALSRTDSPSQSVWCAITRTRRRG